MTETCEGDLSVQLESECCVCLGEHDDDIHVATLDVHAWYRAHVTRYFAIGEMREQAVA